MTVPSVSSHGSQSKQNQNLALKEFVDKSSEMLRKLASDANNAKVAFTDCAEFYGEDAKSVDANTFFAILVRFVASWKNAETENEKRRKVEKAKLVRVLLFYSFGWFNSLNKHSVKNSFP